MSAQGIEEAARKVVEAFEALGRTKDTAALLQAKAHCENCMTALKAALGQAPEVASAPKCCAGGPQWGHAWDCPRAVGDVSGMPTQPPGAPA